MIVVQKHTSFIRRVLAITFLLFAFNSYIYAQTDLCAGAPVIPINSTCVTTTYSVPGTFGVEIALPSCVGASIRDGWYTFTTNATQTFITIVCTTNRNVGIAVYTGACGTLVEAGCRNSAGGGGTETLNMTVTPSTTYYLRISRVNSTATNTMTGSVCIISPITTTTCSAAFTDTGGGAGNYSNNQNYTVIYCPSTPGQCVQAAFTSFALESGWDFLTVYNGNSPLSAQLPGSPYSATSPGTIIGTTLNTSGCLTFTFSSDGTNTNTGWSANITCATCVTPPAAVVEDCNGGTTVCNDAAFVGNSGGAGNVVDLNSTNDGCLAGENQSSWYYFSATSAGTISLNITPSVLTDDYDFAIWGPGAITCPPVGAPIRCSWAAVTGITGLNAASPETSEGVGGDGFVNSINATAGSQYVLVVDNYTSSSAPFTLDWTLTAGASLNCTPLPVELIRFNAIVNASKVDINWATASEINNDYFSVERSKDGIVFEEVLKVDGAGNSSSMINYFEVDYHPIVGVSYYRLKQRDFNGVDIYSSIVPVRYQPNGSFVFSLFPNPGEAKDIKIELSALKGQNILVVVRDIAGREFYSKVFITETDGNKTEALEIENTLTPGIYMVTASSKDASLSKKLVIMK